MYKLDRTSFKHQTLSEASSNYYYWKNMSYEERLRAAYYLNSIAYNLDIDNPARLDRTIYNERTRK